MDSFEIRNDKIVYNGVVYDFDGLPKDVVFNGRIDVRYKNLSRLPNISSWIIRGSFYCFNNNLTSLEGCPKEIGGTFWCWENKLTSLEYCPKEIGGWFDCSSNNIEMIDSWPDYIGEDFYINQNPIKSIEEGLLPLKYLIEFYKNGLFNSKELLMKEFGCNTEEELNAYLLMMGKI